MSIGGPKSYHVFCRKANLVEHGLVFFQVYLIEDNICKVFNSFEGEGFHDILNLGAQHLKMFEGGEGGIMDSALRMLVTRTKGRRACQLSWRRCGISISYLASLLAMATSKNLSLQYVNLLS